MTENCCQGLDLGGTDYKGAAQGVLGGDGIFCILIAMVAAHIYTCVKICNTVHQP